MKLQIPTDINDITVSEYLKFIEVNKEDADEEFLVHKTISIFCNIPMKEVLNIDSQEAIDISLEIFAVLRQESNFVDRFELDGVKYGFIPNLEDLSLGEYIDLETYLKEPKDLNKAASVMYRPVTKEYSNLYDIENYKASVEGQRKMLKAPVGIISQGTVFFYSIAKELLRDFQLSSQKEMETEVQGIIQQEGNSLKNTVGSIQSIFLAKVISEISNK